jgi:hypothetical protein
MPIRPEYQRPSVGASSLEDLHALDDLPQSDPTALVVEALRAGDVPAALGAINTRTRYRFTGLYRVEGMFLRNLALFDRENPHIDGHGHVCPLAETYCSFVDATACAFTTFDARSDERLARHAARRAVVSYAGVPIAGEAVSGSLCHFDHRPRLLPNGELAFLGRIAPLFATILQVTPMVSEEPIRPPL